MKAPVSGIVSQTDVAVGSVITKGQSLAVITDPANLQIKIEVPASDLHLLKIGIDGSQIVKQEFERTLKVSKQNDNAWVLIPREELFFSSKAFRTFH